jgi:hypothetical protein
MERLQKVVQNANLTQDGGRYCWDVVMTVREIVEFYKQGFVDVDPEHQRGVDPDTRKLMLRPEKVNSWAAALVSEDDAYLGQLTWNFDRTRGNLLEAYDEATRRLIVKYPADVVDGYHRLMAIIQAAADDPKILDRLVSVRFYNVHKDEENRIFHFYNEQGRKADRTRSLWLYPTTTAQKLAKQLVQTVPTFGANVDVLQDRMSKKNARLCTFNTLCQAFDHNFKEKQWSDADLDFFTRFWAALVAARPELAKLDISTRREVRAKSLVDSAIAIHGYVTVACLMHRAGNDDFSILAKLADLSFDRTNPMWEAHAVTFRTRTKKGEERLSVAARRQTREVMADILAAHVGLRAPLPLPKPEAA